MRNRIRTDGPYSNCPSHCAATTPTTSSRAEAPPTPTPDAASTSDLGSTAAAKHAATIWTHAKAS